MISPERELEIKIIAEIALLSELAGQLSSQSATIGQKAALVQKRIEADLKTLGDLIKIE